MKQESAARTLVRIEAIAIQGIVRAVLLLLMGVAMIPVSTIIVLYYRARLKPSSWLKSIVLVPYWIAVGTSIAVIAPFSMAWDGLRETVSIAKAEWKERWLYGDAKTLDGRELSIQELSEENISKTEVEMGVLADYGEAAQGTAES